MVLDVSYSKPKVLIYYQYLKKQIFGHDVEILRPVDLAFHDVLVGLKSVRSVERIEATDQFA